jgi:hypothetical protein
VKRIPSELEDDLSLQGVPGELRVFLAARSNEGQDLGSTPTRTLRSSLLRNEAGKAVGKVGRLHVVEGGATDPEAGGDLGDR